MEEADDPMNDGEGEEEYEGWGDEDEDDLIGADDDTSWKIRKGCVRVIDALVSSCPESLH